MRHLRQPRPIGQSRPALWRGLGLGLLLAGAALALDRPAGTAAELPPDPVEELRRAIKLDRGSPLGIDLKEREKLQEYRREFRQKNLREKAKAVTSLGDLARALLLLEWELQEDRERLIKLKPREDTDLARIDLEIRDEMAARFLEGARAELTKSEPAAGRAAANLVGKTALEARKQPGQPGRWLISQLRQLADDLSGLSKRAGNGADAERARRAAAEALGLIEGDPKVVVGALDRMLNPASGETRENRRAAADALANVVRVLNELLRLAADRNRILLIPRDDVAQTGRAVVGSARLHVNDPDEVVSRLATEAIQQAASALREAVVNVDTSDVDRFPPLGRPRTPTERLRIREYAEEVEQERRELMPLMEELGKSAADLARAATDPRRDVRLRALACEAIEQMGVARLKLLQRHESVPTLDKDKGAQAAPKEGVRLVSLAEPRPVRRLPEDPILDGLQVAVDVVKKGIEADVPLRLAGLDALETLGPVGAPAAPRLNQVLTDPSPFVRRAAARVLGRIGPVDNTDPVPRLAWLMEYDPDLDVRVTAATTLESYGPAARAAAGAAARTVAGRNDAEIRLAAMKTLLAIGTDAAGQGVPALAQALADPDVRIRREAATALHRFGPLARPARPALERAANDADVEVNRAVNGALLRLGP